MSNFTNALNEQLQALSSLIQEERNRIAQAVETHISTINNATLGLLEEKENLATMATTIANFADNLATEDETTTSAIEDVQDVLDDLALLIEDGFILTPADMKEEQEQEEVNEPMEDTPNENN